MESNSEMEVALKYYEAANDILSLVRVYCFCGNIEKVIIIFMNIHLMPMASVAHPVSPLDGGREGGREEGREGVIKIVV